MPVTATILFAWLMLWNIDDSVPITVCTAGLSAGPNFLVPWTVYGQGATLSIVGSGASHHETYVYCLKFLVMYAVTLAIFLLRARTKTGVSDGHRIRIQRKVTASILLLLAVYAIFSGLPMGAIFFSNVVQPMWTVRDQ